MSDLQQKTPDPAVPPPPVSRPNTDWSSHVKTYNRFLSLLKWFVIHLALLVTGLYFLIIANNGGVGALFVLLALAALAFGIVHNPNARQDLASTVTGGPISE